jgi:hypothetical protein
VAQGAADTRCDGPGGREARANLATGGEVGSFVDEFAQASASAAEAGAVTDFGAKPFVILTAGTGSDADLIASHVRLTTMSTNSAHRVIGGATLKSSSERRRTRQRPVRRSSTWSQRSRTRHRL